MSTPKRVRTSKRKVGESSSNPPPPPPNRLDIWFNNESDKMNYLQFNVTKPVCSPKYLDLNWFTREGFHFPAYLETQGLRRFLEMKGTFYPDLVKVFYTCAKASMSENMKSIVKGVPIEITPDVWASVAGLVCEGERKFEEDSEGYNKLDTYRDMLHDPNMQIRNRLCTGPMTPEDRLLHYIITYVLTPRATNHAQATDEDLQLVYGLKNSIPMNWVLILKENMLKSKRFVNYPFPYPFWIQGELLKECKGIVIQTLVLSFQHAMDALKFN